jgi:SAM-dependent methyltransferase
MFEKYADYYDLINKDKDYKKECKFIYDWAGKPQSILDIGCGTASYWRFLPCNKLGIEQSPQMIANSPYKESIIQSRIHEYPALKYLNKVDCVTAIWDVLNFIPKHDWWAKLPLPKGGCFVFDIWDKDKIEQDGFRTTTKQRGDVLRIIIPERRGNKVRLNVIVQTDTVAHAESHIMYLYSHADIEKFCGKHYKIEDTKATKTWQKWYLLRRVK